MAGNSFESLYTPVYVERQLEKFRNRYQNHWKAHLDLVERLSEEYASSQPASMLDLGCSIGTFALEFACKGYVTYGLDLDVKSIEIAKRLSGEIGCSPQWIQSDATDFIIDRAVDFVVCFDLLEHLADSQIRKMLICVKNSLKKDGVLIFHTFPTRYDHIFFKNNFFCIPLIIFRNYDSGRFKRIVGCYSQLLDFYYLLTRGKKWKAIIADTVHPNPLSVERIEHFLEDAGFVIEVIDTGLDSVNALKPGQGRVAKRFFSHQPVAHRSIWGVARKKSD